ncbi:T9SS type A sorting domain-containing protein [Dyadobacter sp. CY261]|uniref:T9SS type A sorting domain-containing protein n=1 Tax=Dyadobacter sp. CY261 TaxID=2907203 RepID=UPI001F32F8B3|nr:T9SS type A sorting domain-containing protein [Dyadobacter sp. CY261]MCF0075686.1 T9SS type A sorting domain-containing protein [Dyadobacter sp. CY261]
MKQYYLFAILCMACHVSYAQETAIAIEYDAAGSRIVRKKAGSLPVTLSHFTAEKSTLNENHPLALLKWRTASETNSDHFDIQRSDDGKQWIEIGSVQASGDKASDTDYSFTDFAPLDGENLYRLKMIDQDRTFTYSRIQSLDFGSLIVFYPNPVKGRLWIKGIVGDQNGIIDVQVWDTAGRLVQETKSLPSEGIDMTLLPTGVYTVRVVNHSGSVTVKKVAKE